MDTNRTPEVIDEIKRIKKGPHSSTWKGRNGIYFFRTCKTTRGPVSQLYLNRQYYTGVFKTTTRGIYSGDVVNSDTRVYLGFHTVAPDTILIIKKDEGTNDRNMDDTALLDLIK